jgi:hypothetical protein
LGRIVRSSAKSIIIKNALSLESFCLSHNITNGSFLQEVSVSDIRAAIDDTPTTFVDDEYINVLPAGRGRGVCVKDDVDVAVFTSEYDTDDAGTVSRSKNLQVSNTLFLRYERDTRVQTACFPCHFSEYCMDSGKTCDMVCT